MILRRDKACVAAIVGWSHECADAWSTPHASSDVDRLTLEHVKRELRLGRRAPSDPEHLVAVCARINLQPPPKALRDKLRGYLEWVNARR